MTSKAQRRRAKRSKITLPGGAEVAQRPTGRDRRHINQPVDAMGVASEARKRRSGIPDAKEALQPLCGTDLGLCIHAMTTGQERHDLANAWAAMSASHRNYRTLIIGRTGDPQGAAIPMLPEPMETDPSLRVDLRTQAQREEAAKRAWHEWWRKIEALPVPSLKWALSGALNGFMGEDALWRDQAPTATGRTAVMALRMVAK